MQRNRGDLMKDDQHPGRHSAGHGQARDHGWHVSGRLIRTVESAREGRRLSPRLFRGLRVFAHGSPKPIAP
jgi:hypothetical protein